MYPINWNAIRAKFPVCNRLTYLNAAGGSPMSVNASVEGKRYFDEMMLYGDTCWDEWLERAEKVRKKLAEYMGASKEEIAFIANTSTGMSIIAQLLKDSGQIITLEDEFPSTTYPWLNLGYKIDYVKSENGIYNIKNIEKSILPQHNILVASYVQYKTGFRQNISELGKFCRSSNLVFVVNATQAFGIFPVDVVNDNIDFLVFSGLKWTCAGYGASGLYVRKALLNNHKLPIAGWRSVKVPEAMNNQRFDLKTEVSILEAGSLPFPAIFALGGALDLLISIGSMNCMNRVLFLSNLLERKLTENGFHVISPLEEIYRSGIIIVKTDHAKAIVSELYMRGIIVSARGEGLRISVNIYNNESDVDKLITGLNELRGLVMNNE